MRLVLWPQFVMQVLTGACESQYGGRGGLRGSRWGPLVARWYVTSYRLPIVTDKQMNGQTELV